VFLSGLQRKGPRAAFSQEKRERRHVRTNQKKERGTTLLVKGKGKKKRCEFSFKADQKGVQELPSGEKGFGSPEDPKKERSHEKKKNG